jgi:hypothetical protein
LVLLVIRVSLTEIVRGRSLEFWNVSWYGDRFVRLELEGMTRLM